jgi:hypothetical protein
MLMIHYLHSPASVPNTNFFELGQVFLDLLPRRNLPNLYPRLYGHHSRKGSREKAKIILMGQMTMSTLVVTWMNDDVDTNVLSTLLAYRDDEMVHTWVRVNSKAEAIGNLEDLLVRFCSGSIHIASIMGHLTSIQPSCHRASASFGSEGAHQ